jgi:hypothetical protein
MRLHSIKKKVNNYWTDSARSNGKFVISFNKTENMDFLHQQVKSIQSH